MLIKFDLWLLEKIEKFSHWWQKMFGQDCFWWARQLIMASMITLFIGTTTFLGMKVESILVGIFSTLISAMWFPLIARIENGTKGARKNMLANPEKLNSEERLIFGLMILCLVLLIFPILFLVGIGYMLYVPTIYFCACDPLPPAKSKVKQWLESSIETLSGAFAPTPQPVPIRIPSR